MVDDEFSRKLALHLNLCATQNAEILRYTGGSRQKHSTGRQSVCHSVQVKELIDEPLLAQVARTGDVQHVQVCRQEAAVH